MILLVVKEASADWTTSNGAVATLLNEPKVSLLIDDDWALAKEEETDNNGNDDVNINNQSLRSTIMEHSSCASGGSKSDKTTPSRVELIDKRFIFEAESTING